MSPVNPLVTGFTTTLQNLSFFGSNSEAPYNVEAYGFPHRPAFHFLPNTEHVFFTLELHSLGILVARDSQARSRGLRNEAFETVFLPRVAAPAGVMHLTPKPCVLICYTVLRPNGME